MSRLEATLADGARVSPGLVLIAAVAAISGAAVLFRLAEGVHPLVAAFWRTAVVAALLAPSLRKSGGALAALTRRDGALVAAAGLLLAAHFWCWFTALQTTTVLRSTLLVCLTPVWAGAMEWAFLRNRPSLRFFVGIGIALCGVGLMSLPSAQPTGGDWVGDSLALAGGILSAAYLLVGRSVRQRVGIGPYGSLVCAATAAWLLPAALWVGAPLTGFTDQAWLALAGLSLGPQLIGHIGLNYAVGYLPAALVSGVILLEPVGAAMIGAVVLGEEPTTLEMVGAGVVLLGVGYASIRRRKPNNKPGTRMKAADPPPHPPSSSTAANTGSPSSK